MRYLWKKARSYRQDQRFIVEYISKNHYIKRFFGKNPTELTMEDIKAFISQKIEESQHLEYKPRGLLVLKDDTIIHAPKRGFIELAKTIAGFANAEGGLLILGVKERERKINGKVIAKLPQVRLHPLPLTVTKEMIENNLQTLIQYPVEELTIVPLKVNNRAQKYIYVIEIPPSAFPPHRVDSGPYYQRHNFSTHELQHFQIMDIMGKRRSPNINKVGLLANKVEGQNIIRVKVTFINSGMAVAKYFTCLMHIDGTRFEIGDVNGWLPLEDTSRAAQFSVGNDAVIYPKVARSGGYFDILLDNQPVTTIGLTFIMMAEDMSVIKLSERINFDENGTLTSIDSSQD